MSRRCEGGAVGRVVAVGGGGWAGLFFWAGPGPVACSIRFGMRPGGRLRIPSESGHPFRREGGHHSDVKAATHSEAKAATHSDVKAATF